jgi:4-amino-4-deoxy-L-arabinose transferase-like glycosyltransferase
MPERSLHERVRTRVEDGRPKQQEYSEFVHNVPTLRAYYSPEDAKRESLGYNGSAAAYADFLPVWSDEAFMRRVLFALAVIAGILFFTALGRHGLLEPDEGRYSEIPREMLETRDFVTPRLNYVKYFEKPVFHYWLTAASFAAFGQNEWASRFWPAFLGVCGALFTAFLAARSGNLRKAFLAGFVLSTSLLFYASSHINLTDMTLSFFLTVALGGFHLGYTSGDRKFYLLLYAGMALATLSKGLIGIVLPGAVIFCFMLATRDFRIAWRTLAPSGILLFFVLVVPWFWTVCSRNPDFFHFFFVREHFLRYTTMLHGRYEPVWFFIPILVAGLVPWTGFFVSAIAGALPGRLRSFGTEKRAELFFLIWFAVVFAFFSFSRSKLIPYIIPCLPPVAVLTGGCLDAMLSGAGAKRDRFAAISTSVLLALFGAALLGYAAFGGRYPAATLLWYAAIPSVALFAAAAAAWAMTRPEYRTKALAAFCILSFLFCLSLKPLFGFLGHHLSARETADLIRRNSGPDDIIAQYAEYDQGIPFYLGRRVVLVRYLGELEFGAMQEPDPSWFIGDEAFTKLWNGDRRVVLVVDAGHKDRLFPAGTPQPVLLGATERGLVIANTPKEATAP